MIIYKVSAFRAYMRAAKPRSGGVQYCTLWWRARNRILILKVSLGEDLVEMLYGRFVPMIFGVADVSV